MPQKGPWCFRLSFDLGIETLKLRELCVPGNCQLRATSSATLVPLAVTDHSFTPLQFRSTPSSHSLPHCWLIPFLPATQLISPWSYPMLSPSWLYHYSCSRGTCHLPEKLAIPTSQSSTQLNTTISPNSSMCHSAVLSKPLWQSSTAHHQFTYFQVPTHSEPIPFCDQTSHDPSIPLQSLTCPPAFSHLSHGHYTSLLVSCLPSACLIVAMSGEATQLDIPYAAVHMVCSS
jgi:hypothetical protein